MNMNTQPNTVRLDRWLMAARFYKTRTQAAKACDGGKVKVNGQSAKPHKSVRVGDRITIHHHGRYRNLEVLALAERGLPPMLARELYREEVSTVLSEVDQALIQMIRESGRKTASRYKGRPTKKIRRQIDRLKYGW